MADIKLSTLPVASAQVAQTDAVLGNVGGVTKMIPIPYITTPQAQYPQYLWQGDMNEGNLSDWADHGGLANSTTGAGTATSMASADVAHTGTYSAKMEITGAVSATQGVRLLLEDIPSPGGMADPDGEDYYYSAWFYLPTRYYGMNWWNLMQFKSMLPAGTGANGNDPMHFVNLEYRNSAMRLWTTQDTYAGGTWIAHTQDIATVPVGQWFHIEARYKLDPTNGIFTVWQDGVQIIALTGVPTRRPGDAIYWGVSNYTDNIQSDAYVDGRAIVYVDDAAISATRVWPGIGTSPLAISPASLAVLVAASTATVKEKYSADYVCDGTSDNVQIQDAIDAVGTAGGGVVQLTAGIFNCAPLVIKNRVWLQGAGMMSTILYLNNNANAAFITYYQSPDTIVSNAQFTAVRNLTLNCDSNNQTSGHGIQTDQNPAWAMATNDLDYDPHQLIENVRIDYAKQNGFMGNDNRSETRLRNVYVHGCGSYGFYPGPDTWFTDCTSANNGLDGFRIEATSVYIVNCKAFNSGQITAASGNGFHVNASNAGTVALTGCYAQDNNANGFYIEASSGVIMSGCGADSNSKSSAGTYTGLSLYNSSYNTVKGFIGSDRYATGYQTYSLRISGTSTGNRIDLTHRAFYTGQVNANPVYPTAIPSGNYIRCNGEDGQQTLAYASTITPNPYLGSTVVIGTLTGNITVANPAYMHIGSRLVLLFTQDSTGTRTVTFGNAFKYVWTPNTAANKKNSITFEYDGTNWVQLASVVGM